MKNHQIQLCFPCGLWNSQYHIKTVENFLNKECRKIFIY